MSTPAQLYATAAKYALLDRDSSHLVVLLHGLGGDRYQPLGLARDRLAGTGVSVLAPDARGHGETELLGTAAEFTTASLAQDVLALVDELGLGRRLIIPIGVSMGAAVGLHLALHHRERVAGAVLIRPSLGPRPWPEHLRIFRDIAALLRSSGADGVTEFLQSLQYRRVRQVSVSAATSLAEQFTNPSQPSGSFGWRPCRETSRSIGTAPSTRAGPSRSSVPTATRGIPSTSRGCGITAWSAPPWCRSPRVTNNPRRMPLSSTRWSPTVSSPCSNPTSRRKSMPGVVFWTVVTAPENCKPGQQTLTHNRKGST